MTKLFRFEKKTDSCVGTPISRASHAMRKKEKAKRVGEMTITVAQAATFLSRQIT
jgi:hypothetical protein